MLCHISSSFNARCCYLAATLSYSNDYEALFLTLQYGAVAANLEQPPPSQMSTAK